MNLLWCKQLQDCFSDETMEHLTAEEDDAIAYCLHTGKRWLPWVVFLTKLDHFKVQSWSVEGSKKEPREDVGNNGCFLCLLLSIKSVNPTASLVSEVLFLLFNPFDRIFSSFSQSRHGCRLEKTHLMCQSVVYRPWGSWWERLSLCYMAWGMPSQPHSKHLERFFF